MAVIVYHPTVYGHMDEQFHIKTKLEITGESVQKQYQFGRLPRIKNVLS